MVSQLSPLVWTTLSDLEDLSSLSELSLPILESNSDIFLQLRDLCRDFTNDVPFTIFKILLNFARCSRRWFPKKLDVNGMKKATILVSYLTIVVNDDGTALPLGHRPNRLQLSEGSDPLACDHHDLTQTWSAIAAVSQAIFVLTRAFDVAHHWDHEMIAKLILYNLFSNSRFSLGTTLVAQADWVRDLPITWCRSRHKQYFLLADNSEYTPTALTKLRVEKSLKIPLLSQVKYRAFSGRLYWGINACSTVFGFAFTCRWLRYCWTFWPLLQHCQAPGHWSFWRWWQRRLGNQDNPWWPRAGCCFNHLFRHRRWILSSCCDPHPLLSFYTTCRDALTNVGTEPLGVFAFAITSLADDAEACWSNDQVVDPQDWVDELAPAVEKPLRSRMYGYSLENAPELLPSEIVPYDPTDASRLLARERPR